MPPDWLTTIAWIAIVVAVACALLIVADILRGYRPRMAVMSAVWPVTALYLGPLAGWGWWRWGRVTSERWMAEHKRSEPPDHSSRVAVGIGVSHCGAGCTLGDIIAETAIFWLGFTIAGAALWAEFIGDFVLAVLLGLIFQYFAIAPMRGLGVREDIVAAAKADLLSLTAFEVGLFGWMALMFFVFFPAPEHLHPNTAAYWFLMQVGMAIGFLTAWPANRWLIGRGIKEAM